MSGAIDFFPGQKKSWAYSFLVNDEQAPTGRSAGSLGWGGLGNLYYWIDRTCGIAGFWAVQMYPFVDPSRSARPSPSRPLSTRECDDRATRPGFAGLTGEAETVVVPENTVGGHVPGMPMVYGTPFMILLMEIASARAIATLLPEGFVSVGTHVDVRHLSPTPLGRTVKASARVIEKTRSSVLFAVQAHDGERLIGEGRHRRGAGRRNAALETSHDRIQASRSRRRHR